MASRPSDRLPAILQPHSESTIDALFSTALGLSPAQRSAYLKKACGKDEGLVEEILSLLQAHDDAGAFLSQDAASQGVDTFTPPKTLLQYEIQDRLGEGSMGIVYKAFDQTLERFVAVKFVSPRCNPLEEGIDRIRTEAKALAAIDSPYISKVHDFVQTDYYCAIILEYVEGVSLQGLLHRKTLSFDQVISVTIAILRGLEAAHERGIIHRDIKPSNVMLTPAGHVKLLDFGLAIRLAPFKENKGTQRGGVVGTLEYMCPEQIRGYPATFASDLWSSACVLYELLTSRPAFRGETPADTIALILKGQPAWDALPNNLPATVLYFLRETLGNAHESRITNAKLAVSLLEDSVESTLGPGHSSLLQLPKRSETRPRYFWLVAISLTLTIVRFTLGPLYSTEKQGNTITEVNKHQLKIPFQLSQSLNSGPIRMLSISPDGSKLLFRNDHGLWFKDLTTLTSEELISRKRVQEPIWRWDSSAIAYLEGNMFFLHSLENNVRTVLADLTEQMPPNHGGGAWLRDDRIWFNTGDSGMYEVRVNAPSSLRRILAVPDSVDNYHETTPLPNDSGLLFVTHRRKEGIDTISVWSPESHLKNITTIPGEMLLNPIYSSEGLILFNLTSPRGNLTNIETWAFPFDLERLEQTGERFLLSSNVGMALALSQTGTMVHSTPLSHRTGYQLSWLRSKSSEAEYLEHGFARNFIPGIKLSPDQSKAAFYESSHSSTRIWLHDFDTSTSTLLNAEPAVSNLIGTPLWRDGESLVYTTWGSEGTAVWLQSLSHQVTRKQISRGSAVAISNDGELLVQGLPRWGRHSVIDLKDTTYKPKALPEILNDIWNPKFSPSGKFLVFLSGEQRRDANVYLSEYPECEARYVINESLSASQPFWHPSDDTLFFIHDSLLLKEIYSVDITGSGTPRISKPRLVGKLPQSTYLGSPYHSYPLAYHSVEERFLFIERPLESQVTSRNRSDAVIVPNWKPTHLISPNRSGI